MKTLEEYRLDYEDLPRKQLIIRKGGKRIKKMSKEVEQKNVKKYQKTRGEHVKDVIIAVLVASIVAFMLGTRYQAEQEARVTNAMKTTPVAVVEDAGK